MPKKRSGILITIFVTIWALLAGASGALAQHEEKRVDGLKVTLAITSIAEIKKHPEEHPEIEMHGGPKGTHHLLIHIEDEKTGKVVGGASVKTTVHNPDGSRTAKTLEPMTIAGFRDYGNYFDFKALGNYHIEVAITPLKGELKKAVFVYERRGEH